jgi:hypothetical protein
VLQKKNFFPKEEGEQRSDIMQRVKLIMKAFEKRDRLNDKEADDRTAEQQSFIKQVS